MSTPPTFNVTEKYTPALYHDVTTNRYFMATLPLGWVEVNEEQLPAIPNESRDSAKPLTIGDIVLDHAGFTHVYNGTSLVLVTRPVDSIADFQNAAVTWATAALGMESYNDISERTARFFEEAGEYAQACGMSRSEAHRMVDYVYDRERGERGQEAAGVFITLVVSAAANGINIENVAKAELARIWTHASKIRTRQDNKPNLRDSAQTE